MDMLTFIGSLLCNGTRMIFMRVLLLFVGDFACGRAGDVPTAGTFVATKVPKSLWMRVVPGLR